jgi:hypothetical protein
LPGHLSFYVDVTIEQRGVSASGFDNRCQGFWVRRLFKRLQAGACHSASATFRRCLLNNSSCPNRLQRQVTHLSPTSLFLLACFDMSTTQPHDEQPLSEEPLVEEPLVEKPVVAEKPVVEKPLGDYARETWFDHYTQRKYHSILNFESMTLVSR